MEGEIVLDTGGPPKQTAKAASALPNQSAEELELRKRARKAHEEYGRGRKIPLKGVKDRKLRSQLRRLEDKYQNATLKARDAEILREHESGFLEPEEPLEKTHKTRQDEIRENVNIETARKGIDLHLEGLGPYVADYTRNGRWLLLGGRKGHVSTMDWRAGKLGCELQLQETVRDAKWLHNEQYFAIAQKQYVYVYDHAGIELHCLKKHVEVSHMEFLPYHFLLATVGLSGYLKYTDTSTGRMVIEMPTRQGSPVSLAQNPSNAVLHLGHHNGIISLWSPNSTTPLVKLLAHKGPVRSIAIDREGRYMVSAGQDKKMAVWDIRTFKEVNSYFVRQPASSVAISERNLTVVGWGTQATIWKGLFSKASSDAEKVQSPYMSWGGEGKRVERAHWCPYEDILGIGHDKGYSTAIVPGAGEPNYDAFEANPYQTTKQRQEAEVKALLNKIQPEMISLDPDFVGNLDLASEETRRRERDLDRPQEDPIAKLKNRGRGKNSSLRKHLRKRGSKNIIDERRERLGALRKEQNAKNRKVVPPVKDGLTAALGRFVRKGA